MNTPILARDARVDERNVGQGSGLPFDRPGRVSSRVSETVSPARYGFANPAMWSETKYVVASKTPRPQGGRRDESEACNVPAPGNSGPDTDHHCRFRSRSGIVRSAVTPSSRRATLMSVSVSGSKTPMSLIREAAPQLSDVEPVALVDRHGAPER